jgi:hypothetical protein
MPREKAANLARFLASERMSITNRGIIGIVLPQAFSPHRLCTE